MANRQTLIESINEEIHRLTQAKALIEGGTVKTPTAKAQRANGKSRVRVLSPEARKRIAEAQRKRWAAAKKKPEAKADTKNSESGSPRAKAKQ